MFLGAFSAYEKSDYAVALKLLEEALQKITAKNNKEKPRNVAMAFSKMGVCRNQQGDFAGAIEAYDTLIKRFGDDDTPEIREQVAKAMFNKGYTQGMRDDLLGAIETFDTLIKRFGDDDTPEIREQVARGEIRWANLFLDRTNNRILAEQLLEKSIPSLPLLAKANLAWLYLLSTRTSEAKESMKLISDLPKAGLDLLNSAIELSSDNFGSAMKLLDDVLNLGLVDDEFNFEDDLERFLRLADNLGYGERVLAWFENSIHASRLAPIFIAFKAFVLGEKYLLDSNPEVRHPAEIIFKRLSAPRNYEKTGRSENV